MKDEKKIGRGETQETSLAPGKGEVDEVTWSSAIMILKYQI